LDGYATSVLEGVRADDGFDDVEDELFRFARVVDGSDGLRAALTDRDVPVEARRGLVRDLLASKATAATERLAAYATRVGRPRDFLELLSAVIERVAAESERQVAQVRAPIPLTDEQERRLAAALGRIVGHQVDVQVIVDPRVLGGFVASIGDAVVDGSARHRLEQLRDRLVLPEATIT
ncbi:MAG: F0F1 ATP synthase subunit delta, partial [Acidimicrobiales bacterium]